MKKIESAEKHRDSGYREKWTRLYKRWRNHVDQLKDQQGKPIKDRSNISIPYSFTMLETVLPRLVETLFAGRPYVSVKARPRSKEELQQRELWESNAKKMEMLLDYQHNEVMDLQDIFHVGLKIMGLYGTTVGYVGWLYEEQNVIRKQLTPVMEDDGLGNEIPLTDESGQPIQDYQPMQMTEVSYDDPEVKFLDLGLFYVDPNAEDIADARYCGHVCYKSKEELQRLHDQGFLKINWKDVPKDSKQNEARNYRMSAVGLPSNQDENTQHEDDNLYEVHYYWENDKCVVILNRSYVAKEDDNPFWHKKKPYVKDVYTKVPGEFYGIGMIEMIEDLQDELNTERNQRIDYRSYSMRRPFKVRRGANIDPNQLVWKQGQKIYVDEMDDIEVMSVADNNLSGSFNQEQLIKQDMRDTTGAHDVVMGTPSSGETATATMSRDNNASMRFKLVISSVEKRLLVGISRMMIQLNQQFMEDIRLLPLFDQSADEWPEVTPEDIQGEFHLIAAGSSVEPMANKEAFKQRMVELYNIVAQDPFMQEFPNKRRNFLRKIFEAFDIQDTDDLLPTDEELSGSLQEEAMQSIMSSLPPELAQVVMQYLGGGQQQPPSDPMPLEQPMQSSGANTAMQAEQGMQMVGGM